jgi:DNA-binding CsgD family transcriptional regulator
MNVLGSHPSKIGETAPQKDARNKRVDELIRKLVGQVAGSLDLSPRSSRTPNQEEIIIDTILDGARYLLVRLPEPGRFSISLSPREQEIVRMVAKGYPNKTIAGVLNISLWTVCTHLRRTFAKLGVTSRAAMVARLMEERRTWDPVEPGIDIPPTTKPPAMSSSRPSNDKVLKRAVPEREAMRLIGMLFTPVWPSVMLACGASGIG